MIGKHGAILSCFTLLVFEAGAWPASAQLHSEAAREKVVREAAAKVKQEAQAAGHGDEAKKGAMVSVKGGCFEMGDTFGDGGADEKPVHKVCLDDFRMDKYEVTQAAYQTAMGKNPSNHENCPNCPVEEVSWDEAKAYCGKVGKRLPTEAEWEYAAREGGKKVKYGTGKNEINCNTANYGGCGGKTKPGGSHAPNALGLYDMSGNVFEWVADWYEGDYYGKSPEKNPKGPSDGAFRVLRGGSWFIRAVDSRAAYRYLREPAHRANILHGIRCSQ
jgi:formylglycine-generating enzyme required for sulfatase activity